MPQVTAIIPQKRPGFYNVFIDGKFSFSVSSIDLLAKKLKVGLELSPVEIVSYSEDSAFSKLFERVLRFIAPRPHSEFEVKQYVLKRVFKSKSMESQKTSEKLLDKLRYLNLVNDLEFARWLLEKRSSGKGARGLPLIKNELLGKGVLKEVIEDVAAERAETTSFREAAKALVSKKMRSLAKLEFRKKKEKLTSLLLRRGYGFDLTRSVVDEVLKDA